MYLSCMHKNLVVSGGCFLNTLMLFLNYSNHLDQQATKNHSHKNSPQKTANEGRRDALNSMSTEYIELRSGCITYS